MVFKGQLTFGIDSFVKRPNFHEMASAEAVWGPRSGFRVSTESPWVDVRSYQLWCPLAENPVAESCIQNLVLKLSSHGVCNNVYYNNVSVSSCDWLRHLSLLNKLANDIQAKSKKMMEKLNKIQRKIYPCQFCIC